MIPSIKEAVEALDAAEARVKEVLAEEQKNCPHQKVIALKWRSGEWLGPSSGRRLCIDCGLEEKARSAWDDDSSYRKLKTGGFHKTIDDSFEFYRQRFPCAEVDTK